MPSKRTTSQDDAERLAENVFNFNPTIRDRQSFEIAYDEYLKESPDARFNTKLREMTFRELVRSNPRVRNENLHKKAGGKNLKQDKKKNAKTIVNTRKEYIEKGASNVDLKNYDTIAKRKNAIVFSRKDTITRRGKKVNILRDKNGRFVKKSE